jgi:hypothetical protein
MGKMNVLLIILMALALAMPASAALTHRYSFEADPNDVVGGLPGTLIGDAYVVNGSLVLDGVDDWLEMPGDQIALNTYEATTLEMWYTPVAGGNAGYSMLAYFGGNNASETWMGINYFFITSAREDDVSRAAISVGDTSSPWTDESGVNGPEYDDGIRHHMAATLDATYIALYIDGEFIGRTPLGDDDHIDGISQELAMLGKGGYMNDPEWNGSIHEFRIYDKALTPAEVRFTNFFGPDNPYPITLRNMSPTYGNTLVKADNALVLSWTSEPWVDAAATYNLYMGTDPNLTDPNRADVSDLANTIILTGHPDMSYTIPAGTLDFQEDYYWRVDTVDADATVYQGVGMMFRTLPDAPIFIQQPPALIVAAEDGTVTVSLVADNADTYEWYREEAPGTIVSTAETLVLTDVSVEDEGTYRCRISHSNAPSVTVTSEPVKVLSRRLMGYWKLDGDMTDSVADEVPGAPLHHGQISVSTGNVNAGDGLAGYVSDGIRGEAMQFNNDADYMTIDDSDYFNYYRAGFTASFWYRNDAQSGWRVPFSKLDAGSAGWLFGKDSAASEAVFIHETPNMWVSNGTTGINVGDGQWHMLTATYDPADNHTFRMYIDGREHASNTLNISTASLPTAPLSIGGRATENSIDGDIDEVRIYSYALSPADVAHLYTATTPADDYICVGDTSVMTTDFNGDCRVNLDDFAALAAVWLDCERYPDSACGW